MRTTSIALLMTLTAPFALTACGDTAEPAGSAEHGSAIAESEDFNQADVDFATAMVPHHAQALAMVDLTVGRDLSPALRRLSEQVRLAQGPEIETMVDWLESWDQPVPETVRDHANAHSDDHSEEQGEDSGMPGMMTAEQMTELEAAEGDDFERLWLEMMIEHHRGAIEMATTEQAEGEYADAVALAEAIIDAQRAEIDEMERLLAS